MSDHLSNGKEAFTNQNYTQARVFFDRILNTSPNSVEALYWRASTFVRLDKFQLALNDLNKAIELYDEYADAYSLRGTIYFHMQQQNEALKDMDIALKLDNENSYRYTSRAYILAKYGAIEKAVQDYKKALSLDPDDAVAHNNLGLLEEQLGRQSKAKKHFKTADKLNNESPTKSLYTNEKVILEKENDSKEKSINNTKLVLQTLKKMFSSKKEVKNYLKFISNSLKKK